MESRKTELEVAKPGTMEVTEVFVHSLRECKELTGHCGETKKWADATVPLEIDRQDL